MMQKPDPQELFGFSELEDALLADNAGARLMQELNWVAEQKKQHVAKLSGALTQDAHDQAIQLTAAFDAARTILATAPSRKD